MDTPLHLPDDLQWIEAEAFEDHGGWVLDAQHMDQMGSPYLLAHGWGEPVADARTRFTLAEAGAWRLWVRTRDWCAPAPGSPGRFRVLIDGVQLEPEFGSEGAEWAWQDGGVLELMAGEHALALRDETGFDGRCDALCLSRDPDWRPPDSGPALAALRRRALGLAEDYDEAADFDLVVVGGGIAGVCTSLAAARGGLRVALVQDRPVLGGNNSTEIRVHLSADRNLEPYPRLGDVVVELEGNAVGEKVRAHQGDRYQRAAARREELLAAEPTVSVFTGWRVQAVDCDGAEIRAAIATEIRSARRCRLSAPLFVDASGDGVLAVLAGATHRVGREGFDQTAEPLAPPRADRQVLGATLHWHSETVADPAPFPDCPWALPITETTCQHAFTGAWNWEAGFDRDMVADSEAIRDHLLRAIYGNWAWQRNHSARRERYADRRLAWVGHVLGKRESRRIVGDLVCSQHDLAAEPGGYRDECVPCCWGIDLHFPQPELQALLGDQVFRSIAKHGSKNRHPTRWLPYRCLYARDLANCFLAGRCASMTHIAHGYFRNQRTTGMMGEVVGLAARIAHHHGCSPRTVYAEHWSELQAALQQGAGRSAESVA